MRFMPHTDADIRAMLDTVGVRRIEDLIAHVPEGLRRGAVLGLAPGMAEQEVAAELSALAARNRGAGGFLSFLGGGCYRHYVPAAVRAIISRAEFATSYTPYQAEASQGTLQAIFEFQTLIAQLTGLDVANASMYDGASAAAEAVLMARRVMPRRARVALSRAVWPGYRGAIRAYLGALGGLQVVEVSFDGKTGATDLDELARVSDENLLCAVVGYPNGFGVIEPLKDAAAIVHRAGGLVISATAEALALGLLRPPGELGADIAVGEGQSFGLAVEFGGPGVGFIAARNEHVRQMPGRLVGQTRDAAGNRAFCLTLATREQHIRRERATSNICTNHSLCALAVAVYLALAGRRGLRELAERNVELAHAARDAVAASGVRARFSGPFFNEFVVSLGNPAAVLKRAEQKGVLAGVPLGPEYPELKDGLLISVTEMNRREEFSLLSDALGEGR